MKQGLDDYDLYDELRTCAYRASEAGWSKARIINELNAVIELVRDDDDDFPDSEATNGNEA